MHRLNFDNKLWLRLGAVALLLFIAVAPLGCRKSGPKRSIVSGTVTFDGTPIANGEIRFCPKDGTKGTISGAPIVDGKYIAKAKGGVQIGNHVVKIWAYETDTTGGDADERDNGEIQYIPSQYNRDSGLTTTVKDQSEQTLDFKLESSEAP